MDGERGRVPPPIVKRLFSAVVAETDGARMGADVPAAPFRVSMSAVEPFPLLFIAYELNAADKAAACERVKDEVGDEREPSPVKFE